jgi:Ni,Fe-hydrogenase maturation factor
MKKKIFICGNPLVDTDSLPFRILPELRAKMPEVDFIDFDPTENFPQEDPLYIIDTVINAKEVMVIRDLENLGDAPHLSAHDADLAFHLKWLEKMGKLPKLVIFGVPGEGEEGAIVKRAVALIRREFDI